MFIILTKMFVFERFAFSASVNRLIWHSVRAANAYTLASPSPGCGTYVSRIIHIYIKSRASRGKRHHKDVERVKWLQNWLGIVGIGQDQPSFHGSWHFIISKYAPLANSMQIVFFEGFFHYHLFAEHRHYSIFSSLFDSSNFGVHLGCVLCEFSQLISSICTRPSAAKVKSNLTNSATTYAQEPGSVPHMATVFVSQIQQTGTRIWQPASTCTSSFQLLAVW